MTVHRMTPPWERRNDEPDDAWQAFAHWRDSEGRRSLKRTCEAVSQPMLQVRGWYHRFEWDARARHHHKWQNQHKVAAKRERISKMQDAHVNLAKGGLSIVARKLVMAKDDATLAAMTWKDVTALFRLCVEIERVAVGSGRVGRHAHFAADTEDDADERLG